MPFPPPEDLPNPGIKPTFLGSPALAVRFFTTSTIWEAQQLSTEALPIFDGTHGDMPSRSPTSMEEGTWPEKMTSPHCGEKSQASMPPALWAPRPLRC